MKTIKLTLCAAIGALFFMSNSAMAQTSAKKAPVKAETEKNMKPSAITWKENSHDFGNIEKGKPASYDFTFTNTTDQTVLITNVKASCGCTATNYTKTPIKPGEKGSITATYNAARPGSFNKQVTVTTNDSDVNKVLTIKGKVLESGTEGTSTSGAAN